MTKQQEIKDFIAADEWVPIIAELLKEGKQAVITPSGFSMYPFLMSDKDQVIIEAVNRPLKRRDVVLYRREGGIYVLHRVHHVVRTGEESRYYMIGDSQNWVEGPLDSNQLIAVAVRFIRKGKELDAKNKGYQFLAEIWLLLRRGRRILIKFYLRFQHYILHKELPPILKENYM